MVLQKRDRQLRKMMKKRRQPQLYLNEQSNDSDLVQGNDGNPFNQVLKHSLLSPQIERMRTLNEGRRNLSMLSPSLQSKKANLQKVRNLSINNSGLGQNLDSLSMSRSPGALSPRNRYIEPIPEYTSPRNIPMKVTSAERVMRNRSAIEVARMVMASQEAQNPRKNML